MDTPVKIILATQRLIFLQSVLFVFLGMSGCGVKDKNQTGGIDVDRIPDSVYVNVGNRIVAMTFDTLRNSLLAAIQKEGFPGAITFCNERAYPITGAYADSVSVRRTALRYRNPANQPDSLERSVLTEMDASVKVSKTPAIKLIRNDTSGEIHFFKPIMLQPLCFNCHGSVTKQIQPATHARIQALYPQDQAVDFNEGDLRGAWHIVFTKQ